MKTIACYAVAYSIAAVVVCVGFVAIGASKIVERFT